MTDEFDLACSGLMHTNTRASGCIAYWCVCMDHKCLVTILEPKYVIHRHLLLNDIKPCPLQLENMNGTYHN